MNQFKTLDTLFPCGKDRLSGEIVTTSLAFHFKDKNGFSHPPLNLSWKRKAWYVNASVNAFHMHRGLCREFDDQKSSIRGMVLTTRIQKRIKRLIALAVKNSYLVNHETGDQGCQYSILINVDPIFPETTSVSLWWDVGYRQTDWREIVLYEHPLNVGLEIYPSDFKIG